METIQIMEGIRLEHPEFLVFLAFIPLAVLLFILARWRRRRNLRRFGEESTIRRLMPWVSLRRPWIKFLLLIVGWTCILLAAINPQTGSRFGEATLQGIDIVVAVDVSRSMLAEDIQPNRLERARLSVMRLIDELEQDRIGLVAFAGSAITQVPLTNDLRAARMLLRTLGIHSVPEQGTAIGSAIERAMAAFDMNAPQERVLIILSDGENHSDDPVQAARQASQAGIAIHTVGVGRPEGAPIPEYQSGRLSGFLRDSQGQTVVSRYDESILKEIAMAGGGRFHEGTGPDMGLQRLLRELRDLDRQEYKATVYAEYKSRVALFLALGLALLLLEMFLFERKNKWLEKLQLFTPAGQVPVAGKPPGK